MDYNRIFDSAKHGTDTLNQRVEKTFEYEQMFFAYLEFNYFSVTDHDSKGGVSSNAP